MPITTLQAYTIHGECPLIFCANPRTGSSALANAVMRMQSQRQGDHHDPPTHIPDGTVVFQVVRCPFEVINSLWWRSQHRYTFEEFVRSACRGENQLIKVPMYGFFPVTHSIQYKRAEAGFRDLCTQAGVDFVAPMKRTPSATAQPVKYMFSKYLREPVIEAFGAEMEEFDL